MKTNGRMDKGRYLRKDCRQVWADYFVRFLQEYEKEGIRIWGVTIQNEARAEQGWESCYYTAQETLDGVAVHWYAGDHFSALDAVHQMYPDKLILATEACVGPGCCAYTLGEKYAHDIIGNVNHWAGGWVDWNMILDDTGRPDHWMDEQLAFKKRFEEDYPLVLRYHDEIASTVVPAHSIVTYVF